MGRLSQYPARPQVGVGECEGLDFPNGVPQATAEWVWPPSLSQLVAEKVQSQLGRQTRQTFLWLSSDYFALWFSGRYTVPVRYFFVASRQLISRLENIQHLPDIVILVIGGFLLAPPQFQWSIARDHTSIKFAANCAEERQSVAIFQPQGHADSRPTAAIYQRSWKGKKFGFNFGDKFACNAPVLPHQGAWNSEKVKRGYKDSGNK